jgi:predicted hydrolase (HD superfamily)
MFLIPSKKMTKYWYILPKNIISPLKMVLTEIFDVRKWNEMKKVVYSQTSRKGVDLLSCKSVQQDTLQGALLARDAAIRTQARHGTFCGGDRQ